MKCKTDILRGNRSSRTLIYSPCFYRMGDIKIIYTICHICITFINYVVKVNFVANESTITK